MITIHNHSLIGCSCVTYKEKDNLIYYIYRESKLPEGERLEI